VVGGRPDCVKERRAKSDRGPLSRALLGAAVLLVVGFGLLAALQFREGAGLLGIGATRYLPTAPARELVNHPACEQDSTAILAVTLHSYDPSAETVQLDEEICLSPTVALGLAGPKGERVYEREATSLDFAVPCLTLRRSFARDRLSLVTLSETVQPGVEPQLSFPLQPKLCGPGGYGFLGATTVGLAGDPPRYPFDRYVSRVQYWLESPQGIHLVGVPAGVSLGAVPLAFQAFAGSGLAPFTVSLGSAPGRLPRLKVLTVELHRKTLAQVYVGVVLLIPLILEGLLLIVILRSAGSDTRRFRPEVLAGVAAVLFAILPIRQVLVPGSITVLTRVDYMLALEMALLVAGACVAVSRELDRHSVRTKESSV
jgi:hypothetical protein